MTSSRTAASGRPAPKAGVVTSWLLRRQRRSGAGPGRSVLSARIGAYCSGEKARLHRVPPRRCAVSATDLTATGMIEGHADPRSSLANVAVGTVSAETVIRSQRRVPAGSTNLSGGREGASRPPLSREPCSPRVEAEATADSGSPARLMIHAMTAGKSPPSARIAARSMTSPPDAWGRASRVTKARIASSSTHHTVLQPPNHSASTIAVVDAGDFADPLLCSVVLRLPQSASHIRNDRRTGSTAPGSRRHRGWASGAGPSQSRQEIIHFSQPLRAGSRGLPEVAQLALLAHPTDGLNRQLDLVCVRPVRVHLNPAMDVVWQPTRQLTGATRAEFRGAIASQHRSTSRYSAALSTSSIAEAITAPGSGASSTSRNQSPAASFSKLATPQDPTRPTIHLNPPKPRTAPAPPNGGER